MCPLSAIESNDHCRGGHNERFRETVHDRPATPRGLRQEWPKPVGGHQQIGGKSVSLDFGGLFRAIAAPRASPRHHGQDSALGLGTVANPMADLVSARKPLESGIRLEVVE